MESKEEKQIQVLKQAQKVADGCTKVAFHIDQQCKALKKLGYLVIAITGFNLIILFVNIGINYG